MTNKFFVSADADMITAISYLAQITRQEFGKIEIIHIRGHQDRGRPIEELSFDAQLNVHPDILATESLKIKKIPILKVSTTKTELHINNQLLLAKRQKLIKKTFHSSSLIVHLKESNDWDDKTIDDIWWIIYGPTLNTYDSGNKSTLTKFIFKRLSSNARENRD
jgi:hypothetical protein